MIQSLLKKENMVLFKKLLICAICIFCVKINAQQSEPFVAVHNGLDFTGNIFNDYCPNDSLDLNLVFTTMAGYLNFNGTGVWIFNSALKDSLAYTLNYNPSAISLYDSTISSPDFQNTIIESHDTINGVLKVLHTVDLGSPGNSEINHFYDVSFLGIINGSPEELNLTITEAVAIDENGESHLGNVFTDIDGIMHTYANHHPGADLSLSVDSVYYWDIDLGNTNTIGAGSDLTISFKSTRCLANAELQYSLDDVDYTTIESYSDIPFQFGYYGDEVDFSIPFDYSSFLSFRLFDPVSGNVYKSSTFDSVLYTESIVTNRLRIYPNPTRDQFTIRTPSNEKYKVLRIFDLQGRALEDFEIERLGANRLRVDIQKLKKGSYILQLQGGKNTKSISGRIIKK